MKVEPLPGFVQIKTDAVKVGKLDTSSRESAVEFAEVVAIGAYVNLATDTLKVGDKIFVKSWAVDLINYEGEWYKFIHIDSKGILARVNEKND